jgi:hypothetical protein
MLLLSTDVTGLREVVFSIRDWRLFFSDMNERKECYTSTRQQFTLSVSAFLTWKVKQKVLALHQDVSDYMTNYRTNPRSPQS